jgi:predicted dehydrogenase
MTALRPFEVLVIGAGQIGSRHLQALARSNLVSCAHVVEPYADSRTRAAQRWQEAGGTPERLQFVADETWPRCAAAICASPATGRLAIIERLAAIGVSHLLSEKVLFPNQADYTRSLEIVASAGINTAINHIYRYAPAFAVLRDLAPVPPLHIEIAAGDNGLGCNLIHFLDLFEYLTCSMLARLQVGIDRPYRSSSRGSHYLEFSGHASAATQRGDTFALTFTPASTRAPRIRVTGSGFEATFDESIPKVESTHRQLHDLPFAPPRVSDLSARILEEMHEGRCRLPSFAASHRANELMLQAFNREIHGRDEPTLVCPIT